MIKDLIRVGNRKGKQVELQMENMQTKNIVFISSLTTSTFLFEFTINFEDSTIGGNLSKETRSFVSRSRTADNRAENDKGFFRGYPILTSFSVNTYKNKSVGFFHTPSFFQPSSSNRPSLPTTPSVPSCFGLWKEAFKNLSHISLRCCCSFDTFVVECWENGGKESCTFSDDCVFRKLKSTCPGWWTFFIHPARNHWHAAIKSSVINIPISGGLWSELWVDIVLNQFTSH